MRPLSPVLLIATTLALLVAAAGLAIAPAGAAARPAPSARAARLVWSPRANRPLSSRTSGLCFASPASLACQRAALGDINAARAREGVVRMRLPKGFRRLSLSQQLFVLADLERVDRGLVPALGLSRRLNHDALVGAAVGGDPMASQPFYGDAWTSNWFGGTSTSTLVVDYYWMYDDGPGSANLDCTAQNRSGCWGHRHDIIWHFSAPVVMGAASLRSRSGNLRDFTELFVGGDSRTGPGQPDAPSAPLWRSFHHR